MDIKIDFDTKDLEFKNGDLVVVDGNDCIKQQIRTGLFILPLDWFMDITKGINYFVAFRDNPKKLRAQLRDAIESAENVVRLGKFRFDAHTTKWRVEAVVYTTNNDVIEINAETPIGE